MVDCRGDDLSGRGHGCPQNSILGLRAPQATEAYSGRLDQQCGVEQKERWPAERCRQPAYDHGPNVQRLEESSQPRRGHDNVRRNGIDATGGNAAVRARGEMRSAVVMSLARLLALVPGSHRGTVRVPGKFAHVPDDDEHRREDQQPPGHESRTPGDAHHGGAYRAASLVSRNGHAVLLKTSDGAVCSKPPASPLESQTPAATAFEPVFTIRRALAVLNRELRGVNYVYQGI